MMTKKVVFVSGADTGLGYEIVKALLQSPKPYHVLLGSKWLGKGYEAAQRLEKECETPNTVEVVEWTRTTTCPSRMPTIRFKKSPGNLDMLVINNGAAFDYLFLQGKISLRESFIKAYNVNIAGSHVVTATFMPLLLKSADPRLVFMSGLSQVTSTAEAYWPTPPQPAGWPKKIRWETIGYRCSKAAQNMMMLDWNCKLKADGVKVWSINPGLMKTSLGGLMEEIIKNRKAEHPSVGARVVLDVVEGKRNADVGKIVAQEGLMPW